MKRDPIRGKTIRWTFSDGPMADKTFEHSFDGDGSLTFRMLDGRGEGKPTRIAKYEIATVGPEVYAGSYLGSGGYTLTFVLDWRSHEIVAFASNEKGVLLQRGTFEEVERAKTSASRDGSAEKHAIR